MNQLIYKLVHSSFIWSFIFLLQSPFESYGLSIWSLNESFNLFNFIAASSNSPARTAEFRSIVQFTFMGGRRPQHRPTHLHGQPSKAAASFNSPAWVAEGRGLCPTHLHGQSKAAALSISPAWAAEGRGIVQLACMCCK